MNNLNVFFFILVLFPLIGTVNSIPSILIETELIDETIYEPIKILTYNIEASGIDPDWKEVIKEENPAIIVFVETGDWDDATNDGFGISEFTSLVTELNGYFPQEDPYEAYTAQDIWYETSGEGVFSRFPVIDFVQLHTLTLDDGSSWVPSHDFIDAKINVTNVVIHVIGAHLKCCSGTTEVMKRENAQEGINNYMDSLGDVPIMYMGDLNTFSPEDTGTLAPNGDLGYTVIPMLTDPSNLKACEIHTFFDVYRTLNPTYPGYSYIDYRYSSRIDFIFANSFFSGRFINSTVGDTESAATGSDHFTVDAYLTLDPEIPISSTTIVETTSESSTKTTAEISTVSITSRSTSLFILFQIGAILVVVLKKRY